MVGQRVGMIRFRMKTEPSQTDCISNWTVSNRNVIIGTVEKGKGKKKKKKKTKSHCS